jgi:NAD(P)H dehydrogenase (quinone)
MRIAVTGAAGQLGGQVVELLSGEHEVVGVVRREQPPHARARWALADYDDPGALRAAFAGADTLVFVNSDGPITEVMRHHEHIIGAAAASGVAHIAALSSLDADLASPFCYAHMAGRTERMLAESGCGVSTARASIYTEFFARWLTAARVSGQVRLPAGDGRISLVSRADVGRTLAALALAGPTGRTHAITGPEALDVDELAAIAGATWGVPIEYVALTPHDYAAETAGAGEDAWWLYAFSSMFASIREGRWAEVSADAAELLGHPPAPVTAVLAGQ